VKLGITTPVVTNVAGGALTWEKDASIEDIGRVAETADRLGYHHLTCSEHIGLPSSEAHAAAPDTGIRSRRLAISPPAPPGSGSPR